jgi:polyisoprenyl-phosphate glycosyltransferase
MMKQVSIVTPCYNEEENVREVYEQVRRVFTGLKEYTHDHIFIDNASTDRTLQILREIAEQDKNVKIIANARNFGHIRSPFYGLLQAKGDAVILFVADLQDPPEMITKFIRKWEEGFKIVVGVKKSSQEAKVMFGIRQFYYRLMSRLAEVELINDFTGFGLYDQSIIQILRNINAPNPYLRGLICDIGFEKAQVEYVQPVRKRGITKNSFYDLYDTAVLGMTSHSKIPLRLATILGFLASVVCLFVAVVYLLLKFFFWSSFSMGIAPLVIGLFFFASVQLFFLGVVGEYVGSIHTQVLNRPLVVEKERVNFPASETGASTK